MSKPPHPPHPWVHLCSVLDPVHDTSDPIAERAVMRLELAYALAQDRVGLALEPVVSVQCGLPVAYHEAVPYIRTRSGEVVTFFKLNEIITSETLSEALAVAALRAALRALEKDTSLRLSLKVSGQHLADLEWQETFEAMSVTHQDAKYRLIVEVLDSEAEGVRAQIAALHHQGVTISLHDTGSALRLFAGFSRFGCDILRLDAAMCSGIAQDVHKVRLAEAKIAMARQQDILVVAPGLQSNEDARTVTRLGVDCVAGYLYADPDLDRVPA